MVSSVSLVVFSIFAVFLQAALGQESGCKCGGTYANGKAVSGCVNGQCAANSTSTTRCVVIYREKTPIGYDCIPWPTHVADCATFDDGSRVCANSVCKPTLIGGEKGECAMVNDDSHHAVLAAQLNKAGLDFAMDAVKRQLALEIAKLKIPNQQIQQSGFDVKVSDIKIENFTSPSFSYTLMPPSSVKIMVRGGDFRVCTKWSAKKGIINPGGDICVWSEKQKGVEVDLTATIKVNENGLIRLSTSDCRLQVPIDMKLTGALGVMINIVSGWIEDYAQNQATTQVCKLVDEAVRTTVTNILDNLPRTFKVDDRYGLTYTFRQVSFSDTGVKAQFGANATFTEKSPSKF